MLEITLGTCPDKYAVGWSGNSPDHDIGSDTVKYGVGYALLQLSKLLSKRNWAVSLHSDHTITGAWEGRCDCSKLIHIGPGEETQSPIHQILSVIGDCSAIGRCDGLGLVTVVDHDHYRPKNRWRYGFRPIPAGTLGGWCQVCFGVCIVAIYSLFS
jgi:hypothetical protein